MTTINISNDLIDSLPKGTTLETVIVLEKEKQLKKKESL